MGIYVQPEEFSVATTGDLHPTRGSLANGRGFVKCPCPARDNLAIFTIIASLERGLNKSINTNWEDIGP